MMPPDRPADAGLGRAIQGMPAYNHCLCLYPYREDLKRGRYYPPVGLETIARVLAPHCRNIEVIDLRHEPGVARDFLKPETDLVCLSVNWDRDGDFVREQVRSIPAGILTVMGGRHASEDAEGWLTDCPNVDILVRGDGEEAIEEIAGVRAPREYRGHQLPPERDHRPQLQPGAGVHSQRPLP